MSESEAWGVMPDSGYEVKFTPRETREYVETYRRERDILSKDGPPTSEFKDRQLDRAISAVRTKLAEVGKGTPKGDQKAKAAPVPEKKAAASRPTPAKRPALRRWLRSTVTLRHSGSAFRIGTGGFMNAPGLLLAIESSCDETAAAVIDRDLRIRSNVVCSQDELHRQYGGVVPEVASRCMSNGSSPQSTRRFASRVSVSMTWRPSPSPAGRGSSGRFWSGSLRRRPWRSCSKSRSSTSITSRLTCSPARCRPVDRSSRLSAWW